MALRQTATVADSRPPLRHRRGRKGITSLLAMLYLVIFAALALGFYAQTNLSAQVSSNEQRSVEAQAGAEAGLQFMRYHLSALNVQDNPTTPYKVFEELSMQLAARVEATVNLGNQTVGYDQAKPGPPAVPAQIRVPDKGYIQLGSNAPKFRAILTDAYPNVTVKVVAVSAGGRAARAIQMTYQRAQKPYALVGLNGVTMGSSAFTDSYDATKGIYDKTKAGRNGSIVSNGSIALNNTAKVFGDIRYGSKSALTVVPTAAYTGKAGLVTSNLSFPSVTLPAVVDSTVPTMNSSSGTSTYPGGTYVIGDLTLSGTAKVIWTGPVKLYIKNSYNVSGSVVIQTFNNLPINRQLFFLPTCKTASWTGSNVCVGELYAPDTDFTVGGSVEKMGRIIAKSINNTSTGGMHYDESLPAPVGLASYTPTPNSYMEVSP
jgi:hypothetical protein